MCRTRKKGKDKKTFASLLQYIFACPRSRFAKIIIVVGRFDLVLFG
jgi:hypothetical protein